MTIRHNGNITCDERHDFNDDALDYEGKWYWLCGQPAIIAGNGTYYNVPGVQGAEGWIDSPDHCGYTGFFGEYACDRYWYVNWSSPTPPPPASPPPPAPSSPHPPASDTGIVSFFNTSPYGGWQTGCHSCSSLWQSIRMM